MTSTSYTTPDKENDTIVRRLSRTIKYMVLGPSFKGMQAAGQANEWKIGINGGAYKSTNKHAPKSDEGGKIKSGHQFGMK